MLPKQRVSWDFRFEISDCRLEEGIAMLEQEPNQLLQDHQCLFFNLKSAILNLKSPEAVGERCIRLRRGTDNDPWRYCK